MQNCEELTILIPTINRPRFITRALFVYSKLGFKGQILIGDSSEKDDYERTKAFIETLPTPISVRHLYFSPQLYPTCAAVVRELIGLTQTKFVCQFGDDDILLPKGAAECIDFLASEPSYGAATGAKRLRFVLNQSSSEPNLLSEYELTEEPDLDHSESVVRFKTYMRKALAPSYYIFRREILERAYSPLNMVETRYFGPELLVCGVAVCLSRVKKLDVLTVMFEVHDDHVFSWHQTSCYDLFYDKGFSFTMGKLREEIGFALSEGSSFSDADAIDIVDRELFRHISKLLGWQYKQRYENDRAGGSESNRSLKDSFINRAFRYFVNTSLREVFWDLRKRLKARTGSHTMHTVPENQLLDEAANVFQLFRENRAGLRTHN